MLKKIVIVLLVIAVIVGLFFFFKNMNNQTTDVPDDWVTFSDAQNGTTYKYPPDLGTTYIHTVDWPPMARTTPEAFTCTEAGLETGRAGETKRVTIDGNDYCVTKVSEGAAGSTYTMYAYATEKEGKTVILTFSLRFVQCGNYDEPQRNACEQERSQFSIDPIVGQIFGTMTFK